MYLISVAIIAGIINWTMIIITNLKFRKAKAAQGEVNQIEFKTPWHPITNYITLAFLIMIVGLMTTMDSMKMAVYVLPLWLLILWIGFKAKKSTR